MVRCISQVLCQVFAVFSPPFVKDTTSRYSASAVDSLFSPVTSSFVVDSFMA